VQYVQTTSTASSCVLSRSSTDRQGEAPGGRAGVQGAQYPPTST
jgi:hypothetical protein